MADDLPRLPKVFNKGSHPDPMEGWELSVPRTFLEMLERNPHGWGNSLADRPEPETISVDDAGYGYAADGSITYRPPAPPQPQTWGELSYGVATAPARIASAFSPYGLDEGLRVPPVIKEPVNALARLLNTPAGTMPNPQNPEMQNDALTGLLSLYGGNAVSGMARGAGRNALESGMGAGSGVTLGDRVMAKYLDWKHPSEVSAFDMPNLKTEPFPQFMSGERNVSLNNDMTADYARYADLNRRSMETYGVGYEGLNREQTRHIRDGIKPAPRFSVIDGGLLSDTGKPSPMGSAIASGQEVKTIRLSDIALSEDGMANAQKSFLESILYGAPRPKLSSDPVAVTVLPSGKPYLLDGYHRVFNAKKSGKDAIEARVEPLNDVYLDRAKFDGFYSDTGRPSIMGSAIASGAEHGKPIRAYHGTRSEIEGKFTPSESGNYGPGLYISTDGPEWAGRYARRGVHVGQKDAPPSAYDGGSILPLDVNANFASADQFWKLMHEEPKTSGINERVHATLRSQGFDGVNDGATAVLFNPNTVRSATTGETLFTDQRPSLMGSAVAGIEEPEGYADGGGVWTRSNSTWNSLTPYQKAAVMALMEADRANAPDARNALGSMINRAQKAGTDLGQHVSQRIYQPTIEPAQERRLPQLLQRPEFQELTDWAQRRWAGQEADPVAGATHFLAPERTMVALTRQNPQKYRSWPQWTGYNSNTGEYAGVITRDNSHAFLAPEGEYSVPFVGRDSVGPEGLGKLALLVGPSGGSSVPPPLPAGHAIASSGGTGGATSFDTADASAASGDKSGFDFSKIASLFSSGQEDLPPPPNLPAIPAMGGGIKLASASPYTSSFANGGTVRGLPSSEPVHAGPLHSTVPGRTDHLPITVAEGSFVLPADIVSALGEGNTNAGMQAVEKMFPLPPVRRADGGRVPIAAAGGEFVIAPETVAALGRGSLDAGHELLDDFVVRTRAQTINKLRALPGPEK